MPSIKGPPLPGPLLLRGGEGASQQYGHRSVKMRPQAMTIPRKADWLAVIPASKSYLYGLGFSAIVSELIPVFFSQGLGFKLRSSLGIWLNPYDAGPMTNEDLSREKELGFSGWNLLNPKEVRFELSGSNNRADYVLNNRCGTLGLLINRY